MPAPEVDFLPFAAGAGANVVTQSAYSTMGALSTGFSSGLAQSAELNKVWRQSSIIAAVIANLIADMTGQNVIDDGTTATILANLASLFRGSGSYALDTGVVNALSVTLSPVPTAYYDGMFLRLKVAVTGTGSASLNVNGLGAKTIWGMNGTVLQGGELVAGGIYGFIYDATNGVFILIDQGKGSVQVGAATQSNQAVNLGQMPFVSGQPGHVTLPNGMIMQWGYSSIGSGGAAISFPIAFPNGANIILMTPYTNSPSGIEFSTFSWTKTGFDAYSTNTINYSWLAIGW